MSWSWLSWFSDERVKWGHIGAVFLWVFKKYCSVMPRNGSSILPGYIMNTNLDTLLVCWFFSLLFTWWLCSSPLELCLLVSEGELTCIASYTQYPLPPLFLSILAWCRALQTDLDLKLISVTPELCALSKSPNHCLICRMMLRILFVSLDYRKNLNELILVKPWEKCVEHSRCSKKY